jgi:hypothetical protein
VKTFHLRITVPALYLSRPAPGPQTYVDHPVLKRIPGIVTSFDGQHFKSTFNGIGNLETYITSQSFGNVTVARRGRFGNA